MADIPKVMPQTSSKRFEWAQQLLVKRFETEIRAYLSAQLVIDRVRNKARYGDDVYEALFSSLDRSQYLSMIALWSLGQGIAVRVRAWVEEAIKDLILYQRDHFGREIENVYTGQDLKRGFYVSDVDRVAFAGEEETEHSHRKEWLVPVRESIIRFADKLSEEIRRRYEFRKSYLRLEAGRVIPDFTESLPDPMIKSLEKYPVELTKFQLDCIRRAALDPRQEASLRQRIICNLLVLEKPPGKVRAFRFASPGLGSLRAVQDEKRNLLLLYGWLRQEKPFRVYQDSVEVFWTHLMDRPVSPTQQFFFGPQVLGCSKFWEYLQIPYGVLLGSLEIAGQHLKSRIQVAVRKATPRSIRNRAYS